MDFDFDKLASQYTNLARLQFDAMLDNSSTSTFTALWYRYPVNYWIYEARSKITDFSIDEAGRLILTKLKRSRKAFEVKFSIEKIRYDFKEKVIDYFEELLDDSDRKVKVFEVAQFREVLDENKKAITMYCKKLLTSESKTSEKVMKRGFDFFMKKVKEYDNKEIPYVRMSDLKPDLEKMGELN